MTIDSLAEHEDSPGQPLHADGIGSRCEVAVLGTGLTGVACGHSELGVDGAVDNTAQLIAARLWCGTGRCTCSRTWTAPGSPPVPASSPGRVRRSGIIGRMGSRWSGLRITFVVCVVLILIGVLVGDWVGLLLSVMTIVGGIATLRNLFARPGPASINETLDLLKRTTPKRVTIGPVTNAPVDDFRIPWVALQGPTHDSATALKSGPDALEWLVQAKRPVFVIGDEGSGKTTLAREIAAKRQHNSQRAVVYVSVATWDPTQRVLDWTATAIATNAARHGEMKVAAKRVAALLDRGDVEVVFDGLEDASELSNKAFLDSLSESGMTGWFLFARTDTSAPMPRLDGVRHDLVRLEPLPVVVASDEIRSWGRPWRGLAANVECHPDHGVSRLMRAPMFLTIAHVIAARNESPPHQLAANQPSIEVSRDAVADELISRLVVAAKHTPSNWEPRRLQRWLRTLARMPQRTGRVEFAWWDLKYALPWPFPTTLGASVAALLLGLLDHGVAWTYDRTSAVGAQGSGEAIGLGATVAFVAAMLLAGLTGRNAPHDASTVTRIVRSGPVRIGLAGGAATVPITVTDAESWSEVVLMTPVFMVMIALMAGMIKLVSSTVHPWLVKMRIAQDPVKRAFPKRLGFTFSWSRLLLSVAVGSLPLLLFFLQYFRTLVTVDSPLIMARPFSEVLGGAFVMTAIIFVLLVVGTPSRSPRDHRSALIDNAMYGATIAILTTLAYVAVPLLLAWLVVPADRIAEAPSGEADFWSWLEQAPHDELTLVVIVLFAVLGLVIFACAVVGLLASSAGLYLLNLTFYALVRRLPWRLDEFLNWAHAEACLLRKSGQTYSFRHDSIRRYLEENS